MKREKHYALKISFNDNHILSALIGADTMPLQYLEKYLGVKVCYKGAKDNILMIKGGYEYVLASKYVLEKLYRKKARRENITVSEIENLVQFSLDNRDVKARQGISIHGKTIFPRTPTQSVYVETIHKSTICFGVGPAGTGKTYLAVCYGVSMLLSGLVKKIIFTRPVLEAGENLGFLPGDVKEKIGPYLQPIYDCLYGVLSPEVLKRHVENHVIEMIPLAYMRGRSLKDAFILLDEAQNTTTGQMKMFLTRLGENSKMVITGDTSQIDLPERQKSGLLQGLNILRNTDDVSVIHFNSSDVVRHCLVARIVRAYAEQSALYK